MNIVSATIIDVENVLASFKAACAADSSLEARTGKKLAIVVEALTVKDGMTKVLNQAYGHAEKKWALNVLNGESDGCTRNNKLEKIKQYVLKTDGYARFSSEEGTSDKVKTWLDEKFPAQADQLMEKAA